MAAEAFAPAKVNLALAVTGRRPDGYHLLDSLVVFADIGDRLSAEPADALELSVTGPEAAGVPTGPQNLVLRAARALAPDRGARITLWKGLPSAAGIGGGSSDAAAALRLLSDLWGVELPPAGVILSLGADVPVCLAGVPARMRGIGEDIHPLPALPTLDAVLLNPRVPVPTGPVFAALERRENPPLPPLPEDADREMLLSWVKAARNDLEAPALRLRPEIAEGLDALMAAGAAVARMSGSGATVFGLFPSRAAADAAARRIAARRPDWWVKLARLGAAPQLTRATT